MAGQSVRAKEVLKEIDRMEQNRANEEALYKEIAEVMYPSHAYDFNGGHLNGNKPANRTSHIFDATAAAALPKFASIVDSYLSPANQTYHHLTVDNPLLTKNRQVRLYFEEATRILFRMRYATTANFAANNNLAFKSMGAYGTGVMFTDPLGTGKGLRYKNIPLAEVFLAVNHQGMVDKAGRKFRMTARQILQLWPKTAPEKIKKTAEKNPEEGFEVGHLVAPNSEMDVTRKDFRGMPFKDLYVLRDGECELEEGGYNTFPCSVARYNPEGPYGTSPAALAMPAIRTLMEQKKTVLKQGHRALDPVMFYHDDGVLDGASLKPGAMNPGGVNEDGRMLVHTLPVGNIVAGKELMDDEREVIKDVFMISLFQILMETPTMTATEVMERMREKGIFISPPLSLVQGEYQGTMAERELDILSRQGLLPPMPGILREAKGEYRLRFDAPLNRAQRAEEAAGLMRTLETALQVVNVTQNPEVLDHFDFDEIMPDVADIQGSPARWMRDPKMVAQIRAARSQNTQTEQAIQAAPAAAAMMKAQAQVQKGR
jgi:hypothetical protein